MWMAEWFFTDLFDGGVHAARRSARDTNSCLRPIKAAFADRADDVANGIVQATRELALAVPMVIRLIGTNEAIAVEILKRAGFSALTDMDDAVKQAVAKATGKGAAA